MTIKSDDFVHLHTHSDYSALDGCGKVSTYVERAVELGHKAIAFTEHGTMRGAYQLHEETKETPVKPVYGIEFYICEDMNRKGITDDEREQVTKGLKRTEWRAAVKRYEEMHGLRDRWHLTVWAQNDVGMKSLYKLSSMSWMEGFYYKPRIDLKTLMAHGDGLIISTGCLSSPIMDRILQGERKRAIEIADALHGRFGENMFIEIQPHSIVPSELNAGDRLYGQNHQLIANQFALELHDRWGGASRLLATQDAHYVHPGDHEHHEVLLCIGTGSNMSDPARFKFDGTEFWFKTRDEMRRSFEDVHGYMRAEQIKEALDSTIQLAEMANAKLEVDFHKALLPAIPIPAEFGGSEVGYIKHLCIKGWHWREINERAAKLAKVRGISVDEMIDQYKARLKMELGAIVRQRFVRYFLLVHDLYKWVRGQRIACGPGRGSAAGSLVSFLLGITAVDPLEHNLLFERFISPTRIDVPDIDMDYEDARRQEIIEHLRQTYGEDRVCQIATIGKLSGKQVLKDVARVLEVPYAEVNQVTASIVERSSGDERASQTVEDSFKEFKVCQEFNQKYPDVLRHVRVLEGMSKNLGIHAAGVIVSPKPLVQVIPLETRRDPKGGNPIVVSAFEMYGVASQGLVKMDVLGLRTMTVLRMACEAVMERHGVKIDLEALSLDDEKTLDGFTRHDYVGIFQYDSPGADKICSGVHFVHFEDVAAMTALNRPGTARSGLATQYVDRKKNPKLVSKTSFHPKVSEITADTLGIIVYQEHVLRIFTEVAGFAPATADSLRKTIAKKIGDETLGKERENFIKGAVANTPGMTEDIASKIMDAITFFGSYGFNKSHATAYGIIAYWGMFLKTYYPVEFYWALLANEPDRIRIQKIVKDAKAHDIEVLPPDVSRSKAGFSIDGNAIRGSLCDIRNVGDAGAAAIMAAQPYTSFRDFLERAERRRANKRVVENLLKAGALDGLVPNIKWAVDHWETLWEAISKGKLDAVESVLGKSKAAPDYGKEERTLLASSVSPLAFGKHPVDAYSDFMSKHVGVPIADMSSDTFFQDYDNQPSYIAGVIVEVKYNQVGDFNTGALPSEKERARQGWGKRYANVNVEDVGGKQNRIKVDWDIFDDYREIVDAGVGTPVILHCVSNAKYENMRAHFLINLEQYRRNVEAGTPLSAWERLIGGTHPIDIYPWSSSEDWQEASDSVRMLLFSVDEMKAKKVKKSRIDARITGVVTHVKEKPDKRDKLMGFFGMLGKDNAYIDVLCFGSNWGGIRHAIRPGNLITIDVTYKDGTAFFDGGGVKHLKKQLTTTFQEAKGSWGRTSRAG